MIEITEEKYEEMHGVLPPIYCEFEGKRGFAVAEAADHMRIDDRLTPTFYVYVHEHTADKTVYYSVGECYLRNKGMLMSEYYDDWEWSSGWQALLRPKVMAKTSA